MSQIDEQDQLARRELVQGTGATWITLVSSTATLICCALPILLVTLGLGATVAAITSSAPFLVALAKHKAWFFAISGLLLGVSGWLMYRPGRACPADPRLAAACDRAQKWNRRVFGTAAAIWGVGFFAAYLLLPIRIWLDM